VSWRLVAGRLLPVSLVLALCASAVALAISAQHASLGRSYYDGTRTLSARIAGHDDLLPPSAVGCINCHEGSTALGRALDGRRLLQAHARRGGPPSRYDESSFCRALNQGIDAAWVQLPREMPRYLLAQRECRALWAYLSAR
jgi:hypothetical protein